MSNAVKVASIGLLAALSVGSVVWLAQTGSFSSPSAPASSASAPAASTPSRPGSTAGTGVVSPDLTRLDAYSLLQLPKVGATVPAFEAKSATGATVKLSDYTGKQAVVLVFYQGHFCPVCGKQLQGIQASSEAFKKLNAEVIAISADDATNGKKTLAEQGLGFPVVPDPEKKLINLFGAANLAKEGIAWPVVLIIKKDGTLGYSFASPEGVRLQAPQILAELEKLN